MRNFIPVIGTEIEFYLPGKGDDYLQTLQAQLAGFDVFKVEKERGYEQYEISLRHTSDIANIITETENLKTRLIENCTADFSAKPYAERPGSALHVHVHLENQQGENVFLKYDDDLSDELRWSLGGLLATMKRHVAIFLPSEASKQRIIEGGDHIPTTISWGGNNRTCALRLPDTGSHFKHIEHRVSGADADIKSVVDAVLNGIEEGIEQKIEPPPQVYGDASLASYGLPKLVLE